MKAQFIYEGIEDILKAKSSDEISASIKNDPVAMAKVDLIKACMKYWKKQGIVFGKEMTAAQLQKRGWKNGFADRIWNGATFIPLYAFLSKTQYSIYNELYGRIMLKNGTYSDNINAISSISISIEWDDDISNYIL